MALRLAMKNEQDGPRLLDLAREDVRLRNEMPPQWKAPHLKDIFEVTRATFEARLHRIQEEQQSILSKYASGRPGNGGHYGSF